jgi:hypothetical protein
MGFFKSYFAPGHSKEEEKKGSGKKAAGKATQGALAAGSVPGVATPTSTYASRPPSIQSRRASGDPTGDFRNQQRESLLDVKTDVMCNWLYQRQLERQYATGMLPGEGVVLKKGKGDYACCPPQLRDMPNSLHDMAMALNVRVGFQPRTKTHNVLC